MSEFEQYLDQLQNSMEKGRRLYAEARDCFGTADGWFETFARVREARLKEILKEKDLVLCAERHYGESNVRNNLGIIENPTAEDLGIFPKSQMKLRYVQGMWGSHDRYSGVDSEFPVLEVKLLCPEHFAEKHRLLWESKGWPEWPIIDSEVEVRKGRLILKVNGKDVTKLVHRVRDRSRTFVQAEIKLKGETHPDLFVYRHFGIPDLPEKPSFDDISRLH